MKTIQVQLTITLDDTAAKTLAELLAPAIKQAAGLSVDESDERREARLRASRNAIFGSKTPPDDQGLVIDSKKAAKLLKVSQRTLWRMHTSGEMPPPIRIGRAARWSLEVLQKWVKAGCAVDRTWQSREI
jgi:predicted DNA-binding transcriptional regulator AlpA